MEFLKVKIFGSGTPFFYIGQICDDILLQSNLKYGWRWEEWAWRENGTKSFISLSYSKQKLTLFPFPTRQRPRLIILKLLIMRVKEKSKQLLRLEHIEQPKWENYWVWNAEWVAELSYENSTNTLKGLALDYSSSRDTYLWPLANWYWVQFWRNMPSSM